MLSCLDLSFSAGFAAHRIDKCVFVRPDFIVVNLQASVVPAAYVNVVVVVLAHLLKIHYFIPADEGQINANDKPDLFPSRITSPRKSGYAATVHLYLPGESPFSSNRIPSPETPVKLVFIRKSRSLEPSMGRMASHSP